jgi:hypothetical protein
VDDETLPGGVVNAGSVVRTGRQVRRPLPANAITLHALLRFIRASSDVEAPLEVCGSTGGAGRGASAPWSPASAQPT